MIKFFSPIIKYFKDVVLESKLITFPTKKQITLDSTIVVIAIIIGVVIIGLYDAGVSTLIKKLVVERNL